MDNANAVREVFLSFTATHWIQIFTAAFMAAMFLYGYSRGLIRMSVQLVTLFSSIYITRIVQPMVMGFVLQNSVLQGMLQKNVERILMGEIPQGAGAEAGLSGGTAVPSPIAYDHEVIYRVLGLDKLTSFLAERIGELIVGSLLMVVVFLISGLLLRILFKALELFFRLPGLNFINRSLGGILGLIQALLFLWLVILVAGWLPPGRIVSDIRTAFGSVTFLGSEGRFGDSSAVLFASEAPE